MVEGPNPGNGAVAEPCKAENAKESGRTRSAGHSKPRPVLQKEKRKNLLVLFLLK